MIHFSMNEQKGFNMSAKQSFEKGLIEALKKVLQNPDIELKYQHNGSDDSFYVFTATSGKNEVFKLRVYKDQNLEIVPLHCALTVDGKSQDISAELYKDLYKAAEDEWWSRDRKKREKETQAKDDKVLQQQNQTLNFLAGFERK